MEVFDRLCEDLITNLKKNNGYVKGHGPTYCRVMTEDHSPIYNVNKAVVNHLLSANILRRDGLIIKLNESV